MSTSLTELSEIYRKTFNDFPVIKGITDKDGNRYILRKHSDDDAADYYAFYNSPGIREFLPDGLVFKTKAEAMDELRHRVSGFYKREMLYWCIAEEKTNSLIGGCGFIEWNKYHRRLELAYDIMPSYQGRGIITSVLRFVSAFAFLNLHAVRLQATTTKDNHRSIHILKNKLGFKHEGLLQNYKFWKGEYIDVNIFSLSLQQFVDYVQKGNYPFLDANWISFAKDLEQRLFNTNDK